MLRTYCKSKLHKVKVTACELDYDGSIEIDSDLLDAADIAPWEQVHVVNLENGSRIITYTIPGRRGSGIISLKGPAARCAYPGDRVIIISYVQATIEEWSDRKPLTVTVDADNRVNGIK
jgi:aspartate 1-decarboxylase